jgi:hypothetical protein
MFWGTKVGGLDISTIWGGFVLDGSDDSWEGCMSSGSYPVSSGWLQAWCQVCSSSSSSGSSPNPTVPRLKDRFSSFSWANVTRRCTVASIRSELAIWILSSCLFRLSICSNDNPCSLLKFGCAMVGELVIAKGVWNIWAEEGDGFKCKFIVGAKITEGKSGFTGWS